MFQVACAIFSGTCLSGNTCGTISIQPPTDRNLSKHKVRYCAAGQPRAWPSCMLKARSAPGCILGAEQFSGTLDVPCPWILRLSDRYDLRLSR